MYCFSKKNQALFQSNTFKSFSSPIVKFFHYFQGVSPHSLKKGSLTVEAALMIPIFLMLCLCVGSIQLSYMETMDKMAELRTKCQAEALGFSNADSEITVDIKEISEFSPPFLPQGLASVKTLCTGRARAWTGRENTDDEKDEGDTEYVYVAENGTVYHKSSSCSHLRLSIESIPYALLGGRRNEEGGKYYPCERCIKSGKGNLLVYITKDGARFHNDINCSGLKRTVKMVKKSRLKNMKGCKRCGG